MSRAGSALWAVALLMLQTEFPLADGIAASGESAISRWAEQRRVWETAVVTAACEAPAFQYPLVILEYGFLCHSCRILVASRVVPFVG